MSCVGNISTDFNAMLWQLTLLELSKEKALKKKIVYYCRVCHPFIEGCGIEYAHCKGEYHIKRTFTIFALCLFRHGS